MKPRPRSLDPFASLPASMALARRTVAAHESLLQHKRKTSDQSVLESRYPAMAKAISLLWGYPEMNDYFAKLWIADGTREPIDPEAMSELMLLARIHEFLLPQRPQKSMASLYGSDYGSLPRRSDLWGDIAWRR